MITLKIARSDTSGNIDLRIRTLRQAGGVISLIFF
mgnify:CR=1 FL=1